MATLLEKISTDIVIKKLVGKYYKLYLDEDNQIIFTEECKIKKKNGYYTDRYLK